MESFKNHISQRFKQNQMQLNEANQNQNIYFKTLQFVPEYVVVTGEEKVTFKC